MTHTQKVNELKALLESLPAVGVVHSHTRYSNNWGKYIALFKSGNVINGWEISRGAAEVSTIDVDETFIVRHFRSLKDDDASDLTFQEHLNDAIRLFRDTEQLSFGVIPVGVQFTTIDEREFGGVLVHFAEGELRVKQDYDTF